MRVDGAVLLREYAATPATPEAGYGGLYVKSDGLPYSIDDGGYETPMFAGRTIEAATREAPFSVQPVGTVQTFVEGLAIAVPPQVRPYIVSSDLLVQHNSGTAAIAAIQTVILMLQEYWWTSAQPNPIFHFKVLENVPVSYVQVTAVNKQTLYKVHLERYIDPHPTTSKYYRITAALAAAAVAGWSNSNILMGNGSGATDSATAADGFAPGLLRARVA